MRSLVGSTPSLFRHVHRTSVPLSVITFVTFDERRLTGGSHKDRCVQ